MDNPLAVSAAAALGRALLGAAGPAAPQTVTGSAAAPFVASAGFRNPMVGTESGTYGWGAEGQRIAIDRSVDVTKRGLSPEALVIARTLRRYGAYIGDSSGGATAFQLEQESAARPVWRGRLGPDSLRGLTWDDFAVVADS